MPNLGDIFGQIIPGAILQAIGTPEQQRAMAEKARAEEEKRREFDLLRAIQREQLAEQRRQTDLRYAPTTVSVPGIGEISGARDVIPALIQAAISQGKDVSPEEAGVLSGYRERALAGPAGVVPRDGIPWSPGLEAEATKKAFPELAGQVSPLTVDLPQVSVPRESFERVMTEAGQQRKELATEERQNLQRMSTARYRAFYSLARSQNIPHALADAMAIEKATQEYGVAPEQAAFVPAPTERPERMTIEDEYLKALQTPEADRTPYQSSVIKQYTANKERERSPTLVDLATRASQGDKLAQAALDTYSRADARTRDQAFSKAMRILTQARAIRAQERGRLGQYLTDPVQEESEISRLARQLARGAGDQTVQQIIADMTGGGTPTQSAEQLSRRDPRYKQLQDRKLTDQQIEAQFGVTLVP